MYHCPLCTTKAFKTSGHLNLHTLTHTKEKPHKCLKCPSAFGQMSSLKQHVRSVHNGIKQIKHRNSHCPVCSYKCYNKSMLQKHLRKHSAQLPFSCDVPSCGFKTKYKVSLTKPVRTVHSDERSYECPKDGCNYMGKLNVDLRRHLKTHSSENKFACTVAGCTYTCKIRGYLTNHTSRVHSVEKPFKCSTCDFRAKSKSEILQHQFKHTKIKSFKCEAPDCGFASHQSYRVQRHFDAKHSKKDMRFIEPGCNYTCGSNLLLKIHLKIHAMPMLKCLSDSCSFSTRFKRSLLKHMCVRHKELQSVMGVGPTTSDIEIGVTASAMETLHCSFANCGYQTKFTHLYDRHIATHKKEENRELVCPFCFSRFSYLNTLKDHVQRHIGEKPYSCSLCKYTAVRDASELSKHAKSHHHIHVVSCVEGDVLRKCRTCGKSCWGYCESVLHSMNHLQPVVLLERLKLHIL